MSASPAALNRRSKKRDGCESGNIQSLDTSYTWVTPSDRSAECSAASSLRNVTDCQWLLSFTNTFRLCDQLVSPPISPPYSIGYRSLLTLKLVIGSDINPTVTRGIPHFSQLLSRFASTTPKSAMKTCRYLYTGGFTPVRNSTEIPSYPNFSCANLLTLHVFS